MWYQTDIYPADEKNSGHNDVSLSHRNFLYCQSNNKKIPSEYRLFVNILLISDVIYPVSVNTSVPLRINISFTSVPASWFFGGRPRFGFVIIAVITFYLCYAEYTDCCSYTFRLFRCRKKSSRRYCTGGTHRRVFVISSLRPGFVSFQTAGKQNHTVSSRGRWQAPPTSQHLHRMNTAHRNYKQHR